MVESVAEAEAGAVDPRKTLRRSCSYPLPAARGWLLSVLEDVANGGTDHVHIARSAVVVVSVVVDVDVEVYLNELSLVCFAEKA